MKQAWKDAPWYIKIILAIVFLIVLFYAIRGLVVWFKKYQAEKLLQSTIAEGEISGIPYTVNFGSAAQQIYDAFYNNDWFGWEVCSR